MNSTREAIPSASPGSVAFWLAVGKHWLQYTPHFFLHAPMRKWGTYFSSAAKVSYNTALWIAMIRRHEDLFVRDAARTRLLRRLGRWEKASGEVETQALNDETLRRGEDK